MPNLPLRYVSKPKVIEAVQWRGDIESMEAIEKMGLTVHDMPMTDYIIIETLEGNMKCSLWDYVIKGIKGEFYPCKPDIFEASYEVLNDL